MSFAGLKNKSAAQYRNQITTDLIQLFVATTKILARYLVFENLFILF